MKIGIRNDGFIAGGKGNISGINWNEDADATAYINNGSFPESKSFFVNGPVRIEPTSNSIGYESMAISVGWQELDENGKIRAELRSDSLRDDTYNIGGGNIFGSPQGPGYLDFSPPYPDINPHGYVVSIMRPGQALTHGNAMGVDVKLYTQKGGEPATVYK
ncbi:MAG: hypothetical protein COB46_10800 [Rhodospirillaceae bacterium]|nr:MAG: hypothetical protein COB46_10800 [Rhodospirillaceae bacterium]